MNRFSASEIRLWRLFTRTELLSIGDPWGEGAAIVCLIPLLLSIAIWNGFPVVFYDTGAYLLEGLGGHFLVERSPVYSLFLKFAGASESLWLVVLAQSCATAFVMVQAGRSLVPTLSLRKFLIFSVVLVAVTGIGWYVGEVEPDCFASVLLLALFVLAFHAKKLGKLRAIILIAMAGFAMAAHPSHLLLGIALFLLSAIYRLRPGIATERNRVIPAKASLESIPASLIFSSCGDDRLALYNKSALLRPNLFKPAVALVLSFGLVLGANYAFTRQVFLSKAGPNFLFARLLQDGIVMRLLEDTCPRAGYRLCAYKDQLPPRAVGWLWTSYSPFFKLGGFKGTREESTRIIIDSFKRYPMLQVKMALLDGATQFLSFKTGDQVEPQQWALRSVFAAFTPNQVESYMAARQQRGLLRFGTLNLMHVSVGYLSLLGLLGLLYLAVWRRGEETAAFAAFVLAGLLANAFICGVLSNPHDRYQSRLIWTATFAVLLAGSRLTSQVSPFGARGPANSTTTQPSTTEIQPA